MYRKAVHLLLSFLVLLPFLVKLPLGMYSYYGVGLFLAALINSFVVKRIQVKEDIKLLRETLDRLFSSFEKEIGEPVRLLEEGLDKLEKFVFSRIEYLERDYEKREGYVGLLYGMIGISASAMFFPKHVFYGLLALMIIDPVAGCVGLILNKPRKPPLHGTLEGSLASFLSYVVVMVFIVRLDVVASVLVAAVSSLSELLSVEDNLTIPFMASLTAYLVGAREITPLTV